MEALILLVPIGLAFVAVCFMAADNARTAQLERMRAVVGKLGELRDAIATLGMVVTRDVVPALEAFAAALRSDLPHPSNRKGPE